MNELIKNDEISISESCTVDEWMEAGRKIAISSTKVKGSHKNWITIGVKKWKRPFVRDSWDQIELDLGLKTPEEPQESLNPGGKATGFLSIEGVMGGFGIWFRKMEEEIQQWDENRLVRLRRLITPVVALAVQLDALIERKSNSTESK
jgi:hypothetical protein